ncbi:hypothetical protein CAPTEDRAFT_210052 [Capitella teleta]|uniref:DNA polymerase kappa n=1 Tax=Capitella teleta TaxID=283909 RepID=R7TSV8_CAPTE|nr:hypothetical protein CAPTEDRAFT_210052 [Capitella teleta]|eukprot:ELT96692.1 hypothetical protein CAPTEDRAFT_210052 [Capitella teleta]
MALNDNKAGMGNLDKERINKVIYEMSKGSKYYENEQRKEEQVKAKIAAQHKQIQSFDAREIEKSELQADAMLAAIEEMRDFSRTIVHIDMDAFYAAVEMRDNPSLKNIPMAVGGSAMLSTSNYEARRFGVRAAMPGFIAKKLCPDLVIVPTNFDKYRQVSKDVKEILLQYDPNMCPMSLDEAYLDITQHLAERKNFDAEQKTFRTADGEQRMFGIAPNMMLAKVCSDFNKPNGQYLIPFNRQAVMDFVKDLPVRKVCGIGRVSCSMLGAMGVVTCSDLFRKRGLLLKLYSAISFNYFLRVSAGVGSTSVQRGDDRKSMSTERTFAEINRPAELFAKCYELCEALVEDLKKENLKGKTITLKIKTIKYIVRTKAHSLLNATQDVQLLYSTARDLLRTEIRLCSPEPLRLRLMGKSRGEQKLPFGAVKPKTDGRHTLLNYFKSPK